MPLSGSSSLVRAGLVLGSAVALVTCGETVTQIDPSDVVDLTLSADSARVGVDRTFDLDAFALDADGGLLIGQPVGWTSSNDAVVGVDENGVLSGESIGTASVVASFGSLRDTTFVTVVAPPALVLSSDSVGFEKAAGDAEPAPDTVDVTNGGVLDLFVTVDSIVYGSATSGWLSAQLSAAVAPTRLALSTATTALTTAGTYGATVWLSGLQADDSPAAIDVTLRVHAAAPFSMAIQAGDDQSAPAGSAVATAPAVRVRDEFGNGVQGAVVTFDVTAGGGSVAGSPATADASGIARVDSWTLGTVAGANELTAILGSLAPVVFSATGNVGSATQVVVVDGNNQSALAGAAVGVAPVVSVRDQHGNGVTGVSVTFAVTSGGGSITGGTQTSGALGLATLGSWTLGTTAGANTLSASAAGVGTPAVFTATGLSGAADSIYLVDGDAQSDTVAATLPTAYRVRVVDANGNGVEDIPITWAAIGGGSITPNSTTDTDGYATAVRVLGTAPGADSATANVGGLAGSPVRFGATVSVGSPAAITVTAGAAQTDTVNQLVPIAPQVRVADKFDNPIQDHSVTFQVTGGGGAVAPTTAIVTSVNGTATVTSWRLGTSAGALRDTLTATAAGGSITGNPLRIVASSVADAPASIVIVQGDGQTTVTGTSVSTNPTVLVRDQFANPVGSRTVSFTTSGGTVGSPSPTTGSTGQASTTWAPDVSGGTMQTNGTFTNTLFATVQGTAISTSFTASAVYSFGVHVNPILTAGCGAACHGSASGLTLSGTAAQNHAALYDVALVCDASLNASGYRRVSPIGGVDAADVYSMMMRLLDPALTELGNCGNSGPTPYNHPTGLAAGQHDLIRAWIRNGAPNN